MVFALLAMVLVVATITMITMITAALGTMLFLIMRDVLVLVPVVAYKIDPFTAGVVFAAMLLPVSGMARWNVQIDWRAVHCHALDDPGLTIEDAGGRIAVANVDLAVETRLANADGYADIGREYRSGDCNQCCRKEKTFHV